MAYTTQDCCCVSLVVVSLLFSYAKQLDSSQHAPIDCEDARPHANRLRAQYTTTAQPAHDAQRLTANLPIVTTRALIRQRRDLVFDEALICISFSIALVSWLRDNETTTLAMMMMTTAKTTTTANFSPAAQPGQLVPHTLVSEPENKNKGCVQYSLRAPISRATNYKWACASVCCALMMRHRQRTRLGAAGRRPPVAKQDRFFSTRHLSTRGRIPLVLSTESESESCSCVDVLFFNISPSSRDVYIYTQHMQLATSAASGPRRRMPTRPRDPRSRAKISMRASPVVRV